MKENSPKPENRMMRKLGWTALLRMVLCVVAGLGIFARTGPVMGQQVERPNIIFIMADDLGHGHLGCYGQKMIATPHIDRLAAEGRRYRQCYAGSSVCAPSRSALMQGLHMGHATVRSNASPARERIPLHAGDVTVAEILKTAGYATGVTGKWGLGEPETTGEPNRQGFDQWLGFLNQRRAHSYYQDYLWKNQEKLVLEGNLGGKRKQYVHDLFSDFALDFIRQHKDDPFFLYVPYTIPHVELVCPEDSVRPYRGKFLDTPNARKNKKGKQAKRAELKAIFAGMVSRMDRDVGRIMQLLKDLKIDRRTIVFFTSDNGAQFGHGTEPDFFGATGGLRGYKGSAYEGGLRVPMIVRWPDHVPANTTSDQVWAFWDFLPTAAELANADVPKGIDGISMLPSLLGEDDKQQGHAYLYWELPWRGFQQAVRLGNWKAVRLQPGKPLELYDLKQDPGEKNNIAREHADVVDKIEAIMKEAHVESDVWPMPPPKGS